MIRAILIGVLLLAVPSIAVGGNVEIDLLSDAGSINPGSSFHVGLRMKIAPGWHVYWKNPGDSGLPPKIAWRLPKGFQAGPIEWPTPERFLEEELMTYGYHDEVILPVTITPPGNIQTDSVTIAAAVTWLECKDVCLPGSGSVRRTLPVSRGQAIAGPDGSLLTEATQKLPSTPNGWAFEAEAGPRAIVLTFAPREGLRPRGAYLYLDQPMVTE
ncbi:MAG TPA: protein-disulfide reductase DsbD domain-containing protein, partial [Candidatus Polarisedimenticolia bacterium]|nr:protein-disulfide reductase DsbD domain-containing protein [Candidatus Polarisedimenticolia bacterium]